MITLNTRMKMAAIGGGLLLAASTHAQWTLITNYETGEHPAGYEDINTNPEGIGDGVHEIVTDPVDPTNKANLILADTGETNFSNFHIAWFPLPQPVADGQTVTLYHRNLSMDGWFKDVGIGLVDQPPPTPPDFYSFSAYEVQIVHGTLRGGFFTVRDGGDWFDAYFPDLETWYEVWAVINHATDSSDFYVRGGEFTEQTLIAENIKFRNITSTDPLTHFLAIAVTGTAENPRGVDPFYIDDLYIDYSGANLSSPLDAPSGPSWTEDSKLGWKVPYGSGWSYSYVLGYIYELGDFIYNHHHGWLYLKDNLLSSSYVYSVMHGWVTVDPAEAGVFRTQDGTELNFLQAPPVP